MLKQLFIFLFLCSPLYAELPWGKDSELVYCPLQDDDGDEDGDVEGCCVEKNTFSPLADLGELCVRFHQEVISPIDGPRSHYIPSSSQYTIEAMRKYGFFVGVVYGCDRLMRENEDQWLYPIIQGPYGLMKYDPVR
jgi:hypothetical protein